MGRVVKNRLHVYSPTYWHDNAFIIGDREALEALRNAIDDALKQGRGKAISSTGDGEGFELHIYKEEEDSFWDKALLPYTDDQISLKDEELVGPWDLFKKYK